MIKKIKIIPLLLIGILLILTIPGCGKEKLKKNSTSYTETVCSLPESVHTILDIQKLDNGNIALVTTGNKSLDGSSNMKGNCIEYYISSDKGQSWKKQNINLSSINENAISNTAVINKNGDVFFQYNIDGVSKIMKIHGKDLSCLEVLLKDELRDVSNIFIYNNHNLIIEVNSNDNRKVIEVDIETGEIRASYKVEDSSIINVVGNRLIINNLHGLVEYSLESGKRIKSNKKLTKIINDNSNITSKLYNDDNKKSAYLCNSKNVFKINFKNYKKTKIMDTSNTLFNNSNTENIKYIKVSKNEYLGVFREYNNKESVDYLMHYEKGKKNLKIKKLNIYSLQENQVLEQWINYYENHNKDIKINYDYCEGMTDAEINDAIKTLNSEIISGKGPDILVLDGLPTKSYIDKGLLIDESDIVNNLNNEEFFSNILKESKIKDKFYSIPALFSVNIVINQNANEINDLEKLSNSINTIANKTNGNVLPTFSSKELVYLLYPSCSDKWIDDDNTINEEALRNFLQHTKNIYNICKNKHTRKSIKMHNDEAKGWQENGSMDYANNYYKYNDFYDKFSSEANAVDIITCTDIHDLLFLLSVKNRYENVNFDIWNGQDTGKVISELSLGINSKSSNIVLAKDFVKTVLSEEYQNKCENYFPINKNAYNDKVENVLSIKSEGRADYEDNIIETSYENVSRDDVNIINDKINSCGCSKILSKDILNLTIKYITKYIEGKATLDDSINKIENDVNLYLNE